MLIIAAVFSLRLRPTYWGVHGVGKEVVCMATNSMLRVHIQWYISHTSHKNKNTETSYKKRSFIHPRTKKKNVQTLHTDVRNFMHKVKTKYEMYTKGTHATFKPRDLFKPKSSYKPNPDRL